MSLNPAALIHIGADRRRPSAESPAQPQNFCGVLRRVFRQARPCWWHLAGILALTLLSTPLALLTPLPLKIVVDSVIGKQPAPRLLQQVLPAGWETAWIALLGAAAVLLLSIGVLAQLQSLASWLLQTYTGEKVVLDFRARLFRHVQRLSLSFHDGRGSADTAYRIQHDAPSIQLILIQGVVPLITAGFAFAGMAIVTMSIDWQLAVIAFVISPALAWLARASSWKVHDGWHKVKELDSSAMSVLNEVLAAMRLVKAFGREHDQDARFVARSSKRMRSQVKLAFVQAAYYNLTGLLIMLAGAVALLVGAMHVRSGKLTLGELLIVMAYMGQLYEPLRTMSTKIPELQSWMVGMERAFALLDEVPEPLESSASVALDKAQGRIQFEGVSFSYGNGRRVLDDVSFTVEPGMRVGIVGSTGSGKSTLVSLLTRFYDVSEGHIRLDGRDVREYRLRDLREQFAIVLQEPALFSGSAAENIAFARPGASKEEIVRAAKLAKAHEFITQLPNGYQTEVGERGARLSGGERQRIAIARAFLKNAPIIILDEPTSAVDMKTEAAVIAAITDLLQGRTCFMIAHRLSSLQRCDVLLRFEDGKLRLVENDVCGTLPRIAQAENRFTSAKVEAGLVAVN